MFGSDEECSVEKLDCTVELVLLNINLSNVGQCLDFIWHRFEGFKVALKSLLELLLLEGIVSSKSSSISVIALLLHGRIATVCVFEKLSAKFWIIFFEQVVLYPIFFCSLMYKM